MFLSRICGQQVMKCRNQLIAIMSLSVKYDEVLNIAVRKDYRERGQGTSVQCAKARPISPSSDLKRNFNISQNHEVPNTSYVTRIFKTES